MSLPALAGDLTFLMTMFAGDADLTGVVVGANLSSGQATFGGELSLSESAVTRTLSFQLAVAGAGHPEILDSDLEGRGVAARGGRDSSRSRPVGDPG